MYIRPALKVRPSPKLQFVTEIRSSGATASHWAPVQDAPQIVPNGTAGRVGEIVDTMRRGIGYINHPELQKWTPPMDYEFVSKYMNTSVREAYISRCESWFDAHPVPVVLERPARPHVDRPLIDALFAKYPGQVPPFNERIKVYTAAGVPKERIDKAIARHERLVATADERQKAIDRIFPNVPKKTIKPVTKVIKAVKKKMPL